MSVEPIMVGVIAPIVGDRVWPDVGPPDALTPYATYQQVGGESLSFLGGGNGDKKNARMRVHVWARTRLDASGTMRQIEDAFAADPALQAEAVGALVADWEQDTGLYGAMQDFSLWFTD